MAASSESDYAYYEQVAREVQEKQTLRCVQRETARAQCALLVAHPLRPSRSNYLNVTQVAFKQCVHSFIHSELTEREKKCISAVTRKYVGSNLRSTARLGELQLDAAKKIVQASGGGQ